MEQSPPNSPSSTTHASTPSSTPLFHPALTLHNIKNHIGFTLDLDNGQYSSWVELFTNTATCYDVLHHIDDSIPRPSYIDDPLWTRLDAIVKNWIYSTISNDLLQTILMANSTALTLGDVFKISSKITKPPGLSNLRVNSVNSLLMLFPTAPPSASALRSSLTSYAILALLFLTIRWLSNSSLVLVPSIALSKPSSSNPSHFPLFKKPARCSYLRSRMTNPLMNPLLLFTLHLSLLTLALLRLHGHLHVPTTRLVAVDHVAAVLLVVILLIVEAVAVVATTRHIIPLTGTISGLLLILSLALGTIIPHLHALTLHCLLPMVYKIPAFSAPHHPPTAMLLLLQRTLQPILVKLSPLSTFMPRIPGGTWTPAPPLI